VKSVRELLFGTVALAAALAVPGQPLDAPSLERLVPRLMADGDVPGLSLAVVRDGHVVWLKSFGVRDVSTSAPVDADTIFEAASLSKPVFAYAVLKLVDSGKIDLDQPLSRYLPGDYVDDPRIGQITARRVLSHTTGFPNWRQGQPLKIYFAPGEKFSYSGEGFVYLQKAVERVTGQTLEALMKRLVFEPLHMRSSSYVWQERFEGREATGHDAGGSPQHLHRPAEAVAAASLHTTAQDYARFVIAVLDGSGLRKATSVEMFRPQIHVDQSCTNCIDKKPGTLSRELGWGLGFGLQETEEGLSVWHWGDNSSGFHCYMAGFPGRRLGIVVFTNGLGGHGIIPDIVKAAIGGRHPAFAWLDYDRYDSPVRSFFKDVQARGAAAIESYRDRRRAEPGAALKEEQINRIGYWLLARKKLQEAIAVLEMNVADFPSSWNAYDSLGEAFAADGQRQRAIESYEKSIALNPANASGAEILRKLSGERPPN
jgi:CubicO group peptidase (beta-lactamase class C family)